MLVTEEEGIVRCLDVHGFCGGRFMLVPGAQTPGPKIGKPLTFYAPLSPYGRW